MTMARNEQWRTDLDTADKICRALPGVVAREELTFALRDMIAIELARARDAEREACAKIADARADICRKAMSGPPDSLPHVEVHTMNEALHIAQLIRNRTK